MRKRTASFALIALLAATLAVGATGMLRPAPPLAADAPGTALPLRSLAEIDGDPETFTDEEQRKFTVLAQVLGAPTALVPAPTPQIAP